MEFEDYDPRRHNYFKETLKVHMAPGSLTHLTVLHDDWCAFFAGGYCDCNPELVREAVPPGMVEARTKDGDA